MILVLCFLFKIIDKWVEKNFSIHIHLDGEIKRELLRFKLKEEREMKRIRKNMNEDLEKRAEEILSEHEHLEYDNKSKANSQGTMGMEKEESHTDEHGKPINLDLEG